MVFGAAVAAAVSFYVGVVVSRGNTDAAARVAASKALGAESTWCEPPVQIETKDVSPSVILLTIAGSCTLVVYVAKTNRETGKLSEIASPSASGSDLEPQDKAQPWDPLALAGQSEDCESAAALELIRAAEIRHGHHCLATYSQGKSLIGLASTRSPACSTASGEGDAWDAGRADSLQASDTTESEEESESESEEESDEESDEEAAVEEEEEEELPGESPEVVAHQEAPEKDGDRHEKAKGEIREQDTESIEDQSDRAADDEAAAEEAVPLHEDEPCGRLVPRPLSDLDTLSSICERSRSDEERSEPEALKTEAALARGRVDSGWSSCCLRSGRRWSDENEDSTALVSPPSPVSSPSTKPPPPAPARPPGIFAVKQGPQMQMWSRQLSEESSMTFQSAATSSLMWTRVVSGESCVSMASQSFLPWNCAMSPETQESAPSDARWASKTYDCDPDDQDRTLRSIMQVLQDVDVGRIITVRRIKQLGFGSTAALRNHCAQFGAVDRVLVAHSRAQTRLRPASLGFIIMGDPEGTQAVLEAGSVQLISDLKVKFASFERQGGLEDDDHMQAEADDRE